MMTQSYLMTILHRGRSRVTVRVLPIPSGPSPNFEVGFGYHQPKDCRHRPEGWKSEIEPCPEIAMVGRGQTGSPPYRLRGEVSQTHLDPNHRKPEHPGENIEPD